MAYKSLSLEGIGIEVSDFDPEFNGKYIGRYSKSDKLKEGVKVSSGWLIWPVINGKRCHEFFADHLNEDCPEKSLLKAISKRDEMLALRDPNPVHFNGVTMKSNMSGRNGVSFAQARYKKGAKGQKVVHQSAAWCATWLVEVEGRKKKKSVCKKFSVKMHGLVEGFDQAVRARVAWENGELEKKGKPVNDSFGVSKVEWMESISDAGHLKILEDLIK